MQKQLKYIFVSISTFLLLFFVVFMVNQTAAIVELASRISPGFGNFVFYSLILLYIGILLTPGVIYFKMPSIIKPPENEDSAEFREYLNKIRKRLKKNSHIDKAQPALESRSDIEEAFKILDGKADEIIKSAASTVFLTTAISQNGRLDSLIVLTAHSRLIWNIAHIYNQKPSLRELANLYANVAVTTFLVSEIEDIDIAAHVDPVIKSVLGGAMTGAIPGVNVVAGLVTNSIFEGTANAFLTLRVGIITRKYFTSTTRTTRGKIRRLASVEAASMLGVIVMNSSRKVTDAIWQAAKKSAKTLPKTVLDASKRSSEYVLDTSIKSAGALGDASKKSAHSLFNAVKKVFSGKSEKEEDMID
ncbi:DUF697 domain-containing protein [candidate division KSB1 bacterium]